MSTCPTSQEWASDRPLLPCLIINGDFQKWQQCLEFIQEWSHFSWACRSDLALSFVPRFILSCVAAVASFVALSLSCLSPSLVAATGYDRKRTGIILDCCNCLDSPGCFFNDIQTKIVMCCASEKEAVKLIRISHLTVWEVFVGKVVYNIKYQKYRRHGKKNSESTTCTFISRPKQLLAGWCWIALHKI